MARKKALKEVSDCELLKELGRRHVEKNFREGSCGGAVEGGSRREGSAAPNSISRASACRRVE